MMNWKGYGEKLLCPNFKVLFQHVPGGLRKTTKGLSHNSRNPSQDFNPKPSEYGAGMLTTQPQCSATSLRNSALIYIYIHTHTHTHIYIYIYIYAYIIAEPSIESYFY
jgi:hypothetical protein